MLPIFFVPLHKKTVIRFYKRYAGSVLFVEHLQNSPHNKASKTEADESVL